ncbi:MAG: hypothetical protein ACJAR8_001568 [Bacteroidia bacterium]|jgi:hypothetical protein
MRKNRIFILCFTLVISLAGIAQSESSSWKLQAGYEVNYTGQNAVLHAEYALSKHRIGGGINYNFSDGFASNPVVGVGLSYGYVVLQNKKWQASLGIDYRRQKPLEIVNIQSLVLANSIEYKFTEHIGALSRIGYGVALERAASAGSFVQLNNISGLFLLGCVYSF